jgi:hypothetical protein
LRGSLARRCHSGLGFEAALHVLLELTYNRFY